MHVCDAVPPSHDCQSVNVILLYNTHLLVHVRQCSFQHMIVSVGNKHVMTLLQTYVVACMHMYNVRHLQDTWLLMHVLYYTYSMAHK